MDDFSSHLRHITRITIGFLIVAFLLWIVLVDLRPYFAGILLGGAISLLNAHYTAWKIRQLADIALQNAEQPRRRVNLGFVTRASTSLIAVIIAIKSTDIEFSTTLASLFLTQLISLGVGIVINYREKGGR